MLDLRLAVTERVYNQAPVKVHCPVHDDPGASLAVYPTHIHCYGCGFHRRDPDEALAVLLGVNETEARALAPKFESGQSFERETTEPLQPMSLAYADMYHRFLVEENPDRLEWLMSRGLTWDTIVAERLGYTGTHFTIPVYDRQGQLLTIRFRKDDAKVPDEYELPDGRMKTVSKYQGWSGRNGLLIYGAHWLTDDTREVWICEGEFDALLLRQHGLPACSATNGAGQAHRLPSMLLEMWPTLSCLVVCTDTDQAGNEAAARTVQEARRLGLRTFRGWWWEGKDVTEAIVEHGDVPSKGREIR